MRTHIRMLAAVAGAAFVAGALVGGPASAAPKKGPVVVGTDDAGDWGSNVDGQLAPVGNQLGQELVEASIEQVDATTLNFIIKVASLPASGGVPEVPRYVWTMTVDGTLLQLDGKFTNFHRGACDPTAGNCPPPRNPGQGPFMVRGNCVEGEVVTCEEIGLVNATFDAASGTITIPVSLELLGAKAGSKIAHGVQPGSNFSGVWAIPSAWASQSAMPKDELIITKTYTVPKK